MIIILSPSFAKSYGRAKQLPSADIISFKKHVHILPPSRKASAGQSKNVGMLFRAETNWSRFLCKRQNHLEEFKIRFLKFTKET